MNIIYGYKYSGSFYIRYIIELFSKLPTLGSYPDNQAIGSRISIGVDLKKNFVLYERNNSIDIEKVNKSIYLVRNYIDVFSLEVVDKSKPLTKDDFMDAFSEGYKSYIKVLRDYKSSKGNKILIYYEDLLNEPRIYIPKILDFILYEYNQKDLEGFFDNYEEHLKKCYNEYKKTHPYSENSVYILKSGLTTALKKEIENVLIYYEPILFSDYLSRYIA